LVGGLIGPKNRYVYFDLAIDFLICEYRPVRAPWFIALALALTTLYQFDQVSDILMIVEALGLTYFLSSAWSQLVLSSV
jgi:hypothetical protein